MVMVDIICLEFAVAFVVVATLAAVATTSASRTVRGIASKTVNGSAAAVLISIALAVWFLCWPPTSTVGSPPQQHAETLARPEGSRPETLLKGEDIHEIDLRLNRLTH
jgi:hypothetical protein